MKQAVQISLASLESVQSFSISGSFRRREPNLESMRVEEEKGDNEKKEFYGRVSEERRRIQSMKGDGV